MSADRRTWEELAAQVRDHLQVGRAGLTIRLAALGLGTPCPKCHGRGVHGHLGACFRCEALGVVEPGSREGWAALERVAATWAPWIREHSERLAARERAVAARALARGGLPEGVDYLNASGL